MRARKIFIPRDNKLLAEIEKLSPGVTAAARKVKAEMEERDRLDRDLIEACKDLALNDPDALKAVNVK